MSIGKCLGCCAVLECVSFDRLSRAVSGAIAKRKVWLLVYVALVRVTPSFVVARDSVRWLLGSARKLWIVPVRTAVTDARGGDGLRADRDGLSGPSRTELLAASGTCLAG